MNDANMPSPARTLVDGVSTEYVPVRDRGLAYGDGLFETILFAGRQVVDGQAWLWSRHMMRLRDGCRRLGFPLPDEECLLAEASKTRSRMARAVVRITLTRGSGPRGYAVDPEAAMRRIVSAEAAPVVQRDWYDHGLRLRLCDIRLASQPRLAGIKHLNRLEQVLARAEWRDPAIDEGLLLDSDDNVICATAANLFMVIDGNLVTPALDRCGVAGVMRAEILADRSVEVRAVGYEELKGADEMFLSNAVRGIRPVAALDERRWSPGPVTRALMAKFNEAACGDEVST